MVMGRPELPAHRMKENEESKAPAAKLDQRPAEIHTLTAKETVRGDAPGSRGLRQFAASLH